MKCADPGKNTDDNITPPNEKPNKDAHGNMDTGQKNTLTEPSDSRVLTETLDLQIQQAK